MKRDMEMIRQILCDVEEENSDNGTLSYDDPCFAYQVSLMKDAGLVDAAIVNDQIGFPSQASIFRLTWVGHDFLDSSRDNTIWKKAMEHVIKPGASWSFSILVEWLKREAHQRVFGVSTSNSDTM